MNSIYKYLLILLCLSLAEQGFCQQSAKDSILNGYKSQMPQKKFTVYKTNILPMSWGSIPLTAEYRLLIEKAVRPHQSVCFGASYLSKPWWWALSDIAQQLASNGRSVSIKGFRIQAAYRFYLNKKIFSEQKNYAPNGFYTGPLVSYSKAQMKYKNYLLRGNYIEAYSFFTTWNTGYQAVMGNFVIDLFSGLGYKKNDAISYQRRGGSSSINQQGGVPYYSSSVKVSLGFNFGWTF